MKAITLYRPWAYAIAHLGKDIENRSYNCSLPSGEWLAIHSGQKSSSIAIAEIAGLSGRTIPSNLESSAIVAVAQFIGNTTASDSPWFTGPIGWQLANTIAIKSVPCKGSQGLWELPADTLAIVRSHYQAATRIEAPSIGQSVYVPAQARYARVIKVGIKQYFWSRKKGNMLVTQALVQFADGRTQAIEYDALRY